MQVCAFPFLLAVTYLPVSTCVFVAPSADHPAMSSDFDFELFGVFGIRHRPPQLAALQAAVLVFRQGHTLAELVPWLAYSQGRTRRNIAGQHAIHDLRAIPRKSRSRQGRFRENQPQHSPSGGRETGSTKPYTAVARLRNTQVTVGRSQRGQMGNHFEMASATGFSTGSGNVRPQLFRCPIAVSAASGGRAATWRCCVRSLAAIRQVMGGEMSGAAAFAEKTVAFRNARARIERCHS